MDIDDSPPVMIKHFRAKSFHITGHHDQSDFLPFEEIQHLAIEIFGIRMGPTAHVNPREVVFSRPFQCTGPGIVTDDDSNGYGKTVCPDFIDDRLHVRAAM